MHIYNSLEASLDLKQINRLNTCVDEFLAARYRFREKIVRNLLLSFRANVPGGPEREEFDKSAVQLETVCAPLAVLGIYLTFSSLFASTFMGKPNR